MKLGHFSFQVCHQFIYFIRKINNALKGWRDNALNKCYVYKLYTRYFNNKTYLTNLNNN